MEFNFTLAALLTATAAVAAVALIKPQETYRWLERKRYRYNVTLALYMLTPTERFIFNSILFVSLSLLTIAACLYLPEHIAIIGRRVTWYCFGNDGEAASPAAAGTVSSLVGVAAATGRETVSAIVEGVVRKTSGEAVREMLSH